MNTVIQMLVLCGENLEELCIQKFQHYLLSAQVVRNDCTFIFKHVITY